jgi:transcriptional antiterminator NusG
VVPRLQEIGFRAYLPMYRKRLHPNGRLKPSAIALRPLFRGYVFVDLDRNADWSEILGTVGVSGILRKPDRAVACIPDLVIEAIKLKEARGEFDDDRRSKDYALEKGDRVRIEVGPFAGFFAELEQCPDDQGRCRILIDVFGGQTSTQVSAEALEKIA